MGYSMLNIEKQDGYAVVTINNPPANAMAQAVVMELDRFLDECFDDDSVRAIVITGSGDKVFCAGAEVKEFAAMQEGKLPRVTGGDVYLKMERYQKPIIAAIQGSAFGGGVELALGCHLRILSASAVLGQTEVKLGIMPGWGATQRLPRLIGKTKALELMLTGDLIKAEEALRLNLVNKVVPAAEVLTEAKALAAKLAKGAPVSIAKILQAVNWGLDMPVDQGAMLEYECARQTLQTQDSREGMKAFFEKRAPNFKGI